jgi:hypothetical protein
MEAPVADLLYVLTLVAFFALMVAFVRVCERVVGKEDVTEADLTDDIEGGSATVPSSSESTHNTPEEVGS